MSTPVSSEVTQLLHSLFVPPSVLDRLRREDRRIAGLGQIAAMRDVRVVPALLSLWALGGSLAPHAAGAIAALVGSAGAVQLSLLDEQVRQSPWAYYRRHAWDSLSPEGVFRLAQSADGDVAVIGLLASHANGFVRAAALELLAKSTDGREIPFLALRTNDWVKPVAARATELLTSRLRPDNRQAVLDGLPFIARVLGQRRRDHIEIERGLTRVLLSGEGDHVLASVTRFDTTVRRVVYDLLNSGDAALRRRLIESALSDPDVFIRGRAVRALAAEPDVEHRVANLERLLRNDPFPAVRMVALAVLAEHTPERLAAIFPDVLFDRATSVRGLARFVARAHQLPFVPRDVCVQGLASGIPRQIDAAIEGIGATGAGLDADIVTPFLQSAVSRRRRSALRAFARLDTERAIPSAVAALADEASSVRSAAAGILAANANRVDFDVVGRRVRSLPDPRARRALLRLFMNAPKWEAAALLLEALADPDDAARSFAARLIGGWLGGFNRSQTRPTASQLRRIQTLLDSVALRMPKETERLLRFSIKAD